MVRNEEQNMRQLLPLKRAPSFLPPILGFSHSFSFSCTKETYCDEIEEVYRNDEWRLSFKKKKVTTVEKDVFDKVLDSVIDLDNVPDIAEMQEMQEN